MGFANFIADLASVIYASRGVASRHITLRTRQLKRYRVSRGASSVTSAQVAEQDLETDPRSAPTALQDDTSKFSQSHGAALQSSQNVYPDFKLWKTSRDNGAGASSKLMPAPELGRIAEEVDALPMSIDLNVFRTKRVASMAGVGGPPSGQVAKSNRYVETIGGGRRTLDSGNDLLANAILLVKNHRTTQNYGSLSSPHKEDARKSGKGRLRMDIESAMSATENILVTGIELLSSGGQMLQCSIEVIEASHLNASDRVSQSRSSVSSAEVALIQGTKLVHSVAQLIHDSHEAIGNHHSRRKSSLVFHSGWEAIMASRELTDQVGRDVELFKEMKPQPLSILNTGNTEPATPMTAPSSAVLELDPLQSHPHSYPLRESRVPASRLSRLWNYGGLAAGMLGGALAESVNRGLGRGGDDGSVLLNPANMERLVSKLSRMRGAALKLGQMISFQDAKMLPPAIKEVLQRVQDRADYMPSWQRDKVLASNLGKDWRDLFETFEDKPIAAASIGQVHRARLRGLEGGEAKEVAVKIQFPGVADSINSDLDNLSVFLTASRLLPKGLYLDKTIDNARTELAWECDYEREAGCVTRYKELLANEGDVFLVPDVYLKASGKQVLTMEYMEGTGVTRVKKFNQEQRDWIGTQILRLCLREIAEFRFMQTDPNWTNFLFNAKTSKLELLDFGASREFPARFADLYVRLLVQASRLDREGVKTLSEELGYLTGHESKTMLDAHVGSVLTLAEPFLNSAPEVYDFKDQTITERVKSFIPTMIKERLSPPPEETYSLHRKLSGAFLLCARLGSKVPCRRLFKESMKANGYL